MDLWIKSLYFFSLFISCCSYSTSSLMFLPLQSNTSLPKYFAFLRWRSLGKIVPSFRLLHHKSCCSSPSQASWIFFPTSSKSFFFSSPKKIGVFPIISFLSKPYSSITLLLISINLILSKKKVILFCSSQKINMIQ